MSAPDLTFDVSNRCLWHGEMRVPLTPKTFRVLQYLQERSHQLVSKDQLLDAVWPGRRVEEAQVRQFITELRRVLQDSAEAPRYIQTVHGHGYRFVGQLRVKARAAHSEEPASEAPAPSRCVALPELSLGCMQCVIGRESERELLAGWLARATKRELVAGFVSGEIGIGKTTLIDCFLRQARTREDVLVLQGNCSDGFQNMEPYLPVLEALENWLDQDATHRARDLLRQVAPMWLLQMTGRLSTDERYELVKHTQGASPEHRVREIRRLFDALGETRTVILWLEDVHWADPSTINLLHELARVRRASRLLLLCTLRSTGRHGAADSLASLLTELRLQGRCAEMHLRPLDQQAVTRYVEVRSPQLHRDWTSVVFERTEGNPLFMVKLVDELEADERALDARSPSEQERIALPVPNSLRALIEQQLARLDEPLQHALLGGAVAGSRFSAALVAAALGHEPDQAEQRCEWLAQHGHFIRRIGTCEWPDGTEAAQYEFAHIFYQEVFYERITPSLRSKLHLNIGRRLETAYRNSAHHIASELSWHFEKGRDLLALVRHLTQASQHALRQCGFQEASALATKALQLLLNLPATPDRASDELNLRLLLGHAARGLQSIAPSLMESNYERARELCRKVTDPTLRVAALWGLVMYHSNYGDQRTARRFGEEILLESQKRAPGIVTVAGHCALAMVHFQLGEFIHAVRHARLGLKHYRAEQHEEATHLAGVDLGVQCRGHLALANWVIGERAQALAEARELLLCAEQTGHPYTRAIAFFRVAKLHQFRGDPVQTLEFAQRCKTMALNRGFAPLEALASILCGWANAIRRKPAGDATEIETGIAAYCNRGAKLGGPWHQSMLAQAYAAQGETDKARQAVELGLQAMLATGDCAVEAVLHRMRGELAFQASSQLDQAEACFAQSMNIACSQEAKYWELRAAAQMAMLWKHQGKRAEAAKLLAHARCAAHSRTSRTRI